MEHVRPCKRTKYAELEATEAQRLAVVVQCLRVGVNIRFELDTQQTLRAATHQASANMQSAQLKRSGAQVRYLEQVYPVAQWRCIVDNHGERCSKHFTRNRANVHSNL